MNRIKTILTRISLKENRWLFISAIILGLILGLVFNGGLDRSSPINPESEITEEHDHSKNQIWTCSMHPQIQQPKAGKCPLCGMDLIPVSSEEEEVGFNQLKLSENAIKLAEIRTAQVERLEVSKVIRMSGKIAFNETNIANITSRIPGRIDKIYVNYTGTKIKKGERMVNLYSPELITAQQELLQSLRALQKSRTPELKKSSLKLVEASRKKLLLWGLTKAQIRKFENQSNTVNHIIIYSPMNGIVVKKDAFEGMYVNTGTKLYTIANLMDLWVLLDAYESDISWIKTGQSVEFETEAYPGEIFKGKVTFIDPVIDPKTRTIKVRVNVKNPDHKLKPDMFVSAIVHAGIENKKRDRNYISPLVIPSTAPLVTGKRAVVYVAVPGKKGVFEGRNITLGSLANNYYIVTEGLKEGENVVVNGAFKIDSDLQIQAKPSMMNPKGGGPKPGHDHGDSSVQMV
ncbi:MAG: efflux RND transporter periplasmic adaptor subunit, partial [Acidobacteriota bacterium]